MKVQKTDRIWRPQSYLMTRPCVTPMFGWSCPFTIFSLKLKTRLCPKIIALTAQTSATYTARGCIIRSGYKWLIQGNLCKGNLLSVLHEAVSSLIFTSLTDHLYDGCCYRLSWSKETGYQAPTKKAWMRFWTSTGGFLPSKGLKTYTY